MRGAARGFYDVVARVALLDMRGLNTDDHARLEDGLRVRGELEPFVDGQADAVAECSPRVYEAPPRELAPPKFEDLACTRARTELVDQGPLNLDQVRVDRSLPRGGR